MKHSPLPVETTQAIPDSPIMEIAESTHDRVMRALEGFVQGANDVSRSIARMSAYTAGNVATTLGYHVPVAIIRGVKGQKLSPPSDALSA